jgi:hypothetical protein
MLENSMPKLHKDIVGKGGGTKTKIYCQGTICQKQVLAVLQAVKLGITEAGNKAKPLQYSGRGEGVAFVPIQSRCSNVQWPPTSIDSKRRSKD